MRKDGIKFPALRKMVGNAKPLGSVGRVRGAGRSMNESGMLGQLPPTNFRQGICWHSEAAVAVVGLRGTYITA